MDESSFYLWLLKYSNTGFLPVSSPLSSVPSLIPTECFQHSAAASETTFWLGSFETAENGDTGNQWKRAQTNKLANQQCAQSFSCHMWAVKELDAGRSSLCVCPCIIVRAGYQRCQHENKPVATGALSHGTTSGNSGETHSSRFRPLLVYSVFWTWAQLELPPFCRVDATLMQENGVLAWLVYNLSSG